MITNERPSRFGQTAHFQPRPPVQEYVLKSGRVQIEQRIFTFHLKENWRGRFLLITEIIGERFAGIIIPSGGLEDFQKLLSRLIASGKRSPALTAPSPMSADEQRVLISDQMRVERKNITCLLIQHSIGRSLHIVEAHSGHTNELIIPESLLEEFETQMDEMVKSSNEQPFPFQPPVYPQNRPLLDESVLESILVPIERKSFMLVLKENRHGRFLRITEKAGRQFACVFIPACGLEQFRKFLDEMIAIPGKAPSVSDLEAQRQAFADEIVLNRARMQVKEKTIVLVLKENLRGRYLRLVEESPGHDPVSLVIPATGLEEFRKHVDAIINISAKRPVRSLP